jgi:hypothetical protein
MEDYICVVYKEHTLGCLRGRNLQILNSKPLLGGIDWKNGPFLIPENEVSHIRKANKQDFEHFNVLFNNEYLS